MHISDFDYDLPAELIAQQPTDQRETSRMLVLNKRSSTFCDSLFFRLPELLQRGDCLVLNDTKVFPARLLGTRKGFSASVELFLVKNIGVGCWEVLVKPGRALRVGAEAVFGDGSLVAEVLKVLPNGHRIVELKASVLSVDELINRFGTTPLPPYIKREDGHENLRLDSERYQTIYARERGSIAAPTAGLHFTKELLQQIEDKGVDVVFLTHHVGYATFQPVRVENIEEHKIDQESFFIPENSASKINQAKKRGSRVIAVGTTTTRALETAAESGTVEPGSKTTELYIYPGHTFKAVDALITNFHLPKSSLIMLVSAFAGPDFVLEAYRHAVAEKYRFYSYGDCMFIY